MGKWANWLLRAQSENIYLFRGPASSRKLPEMDFFVSPRLRKWGGLTVADFGHFFEKIHGNYHRVRFFGKCGPDTVEPRGMRGRFCGGVSGKTAPFEAMTRTVLFLLFLFSLICRGQSVIIIDAGHGGAKPSGSQEAKSLSSPNNAVSPGGLKEKDLTLELAQKVIARINAKNAGLKAVPTRTEDINPDFSKRAKVAADHKAAWFLSIHFNAVPKGAKKASGTLGMVQMKSRNPHHAE